MEPLLTRRKSRVSWLSPSLPPWQVLFFCTGPIGQEGHTNNLLHGETEFCLVRGNKFRFFPEGQSSIHQYAWIEEWAPGSIYFFQSTHQAFPGKPNGSGSALNQFKFKPKLSRPHHPHRLIILSTLKSQHRDSPEKKVAKCFLRDQPLMILIFTAHDLTILSMACPCMP